MAEQAIQDFGNLVNYLCSENFDRKKEYDILVQIEELVSSKNDFLRRTSYKNNMNMLLNELWNKRLCNVTWISSCNFEQLFCLLNILKGFFKDQNFLKSIVRSGELRHFFSYLQKLINDPNDKFDNNERNLLIRNFLILTNKLLCFDDVVNFIVEESTHQTLVGALCLDDVSVVKISLTSLRLLMKRPDMLASLSANLQFLNALLIILRDYGTSVKQLASKLLCEALCQSTAKELILFLNGMPILLGFLHEGAAQRHSRCPNEDLEDDFDCGGGCRRNSSGFYPASMLTNVCWTIVHIVEIEQGAKSLCEAGGIPILLDLLSDHGNKKHSATCSGRVVLKNCTEEDLCSEMSLKSVICACIYALGSISYSYCLLFVNNNCLYHLGLLILTPKSAFNAAPPSAKYQSARIELLGNVFRALRILFACERNRRPIKKFFPTLLYEKFIDVDRFVKDLHAYADLVALLDTCNTEQINEIYESIKASDQNREPIQVIRDYAFLELLGTGAFGSVYKTKKFINETQPISYYAIKEVNIRQMQAGNKTSQWLNNLKELSIIKEQLRHPNIVRYYRTFEFNDKVYIVMELVEGATLAEHISSAREKQEKFAESWIWLIFTQLVQALRYLHKEKHIVHRDLSPNNIMLGGSDGEVVKLTDFGLAKQTSSSAGAQMNSIVGTLFYRCPEIMQDEPYTEKADIWSLGCILYQMCALRPPFDTQNLLKLSSLIVRAEYEALSSDVYSNSVSVVIGHCLTSTASQRPDIIGVAALIADKLLDRLDLKIKQSYRLKKQLIREKHLSLRYKTYSTSGLSLQDINEQDLLNLPAYEHDNVNYNGDPLSSSSGASSLNGLMSQSITSLGSTPMQGSTSPLSLNISSKTSPSSLQAAPNNRNLHLFSSPPSLPRQHSAATASQQQQQQSTINTNVGQRTLSGGARPRMLSRVPRTSSQNELMQLTYSTNSPGGGSADGSICGSPSSSRNVLINNMHNANLVLSPPSTRTLSPSSTGSHRSLRAIQMSSRKLRELHDPFIPLLSIVHKLLYILHLPPLHLPDFLSTQSQSRPQAQLLWIKQHLVLRFIRGLIFPPFFNRNHSNNNNNNNETAAAALPPPPPRDRQQHLLFLKEELRRISQCQDELMDVDINVESIRHLFASQTMRAVLSTNNSNNNATASSTTTTTATGVGEDQSQENWEDDQLSELVEEGMTYERMHQFIEAIVSHHGYHSNASSSTR